MKLHLPIFLRKAILTLMLAYGVPAVHAASLTLGTGDSLSVDYSVSGSLQDLNNGTLQLSGGTTLQLSSCGEGDGKTYTLVTGISGLLDAEGNAITLDSSNDAISNYFDTTQPGTGFWADGTLQLVRHNEKVLDAVTITTRQTGDVDYQYYEGVSFADIEYTTSSSSAYGGAISGTVTMEGNGDITFSGNKAIYNSSSASSGTISAFGGAIDGAVTMTGNGNISFSGNTANASSSSAYGGAIRGTVTMEGNGDITFSGNKAIAGSYFVAGGAIYGTVTMVGNGNISFSGNTVSSSSSSAYGGAISGTVTLTGNGDIEFSGNTASSSSYFVAGGAIYGTVTLTGNGDIEFSGNTASSSSSSASGGAIDGDVTLTGNGNISFSGNTASSNSSSAEGGAICTAVNLSIRNNDSVLFEQNAEVCNGAYRLRSIYAYGGSGDVISLSAAAGKSIEFRDSVYIGSGSTVNLNADYGDIKQQGDIIFTGKYTEQHLNDLLDAAEAGRTATAEEILNSRTTEIYSVTNLYGGRLRVEEGAIYHGWGITAMEGSAATVRVQNATLKHSGYDLTFNAGTTLELAGANSISGNLNLLDGSTLHIDFAGNEFTTNLDGSPLALTGDAFLRLTGAGNGDGKTYTLLTGVSGLLDAQGNAITLDDTNNAISNYFDSTRPGSGFWTGATLQLTDAGTLQLVLHNETVKETITITSRQTYPAAYQYYVGISFDDIFDGAIYVDGDITFNGNGRVEFNGNKAFYSGGAIYGFGDITMSHNGSIVFCGNSTNGSGLYGSGSAMGGAINGNSTISLCNNGSVEFSDNTASSTSIYTYAFGGAINVDDACTITLSNNDGVTFLRNSASSYDNAQGGAICARYLPASIVLDNNGSVEFCGNKVSSDTAAVGGAIFCLSTRMSDNGSVSFVGNTAHGRAGSSRASGGAISGLVTLQDSGNVLFEENLAFTISASAYGGAISGAVTMNDNGDIVFRGNTVSISLSDYGEEAYGGAIYANGNLSFCNNDFLLFEKNAEVCSGTYRLRSIYANDEESDISFSAAAGKTIEFRDSAYIASGASVNLNADYTYLDSEGNSTRVKQQGDIIFTGKYTEQHLNEVLDDAGIARTATVEEIQASRTTEVNTMTNLYGGRLRVEDGAIYQGRGITAHAGSAATVLVKDATLSHGGYDLTFNAGTTLEMTGTSRISGNVQMLEGSSLLLNPGNSQLATYIAGEFNIADGVTLSLNLENTWTDVNGILMYVSGNTTGWSAEKVQISGTGAACSLTWVDNLLVVNYDDSSFNRFFNGSSVVTTTQLNGVNAHHYESLKYENLKSSADGETTYCSGGAIYGEKYSFISLNNNNVIEFSGNSVDGGYIARGGAIYGDSYSSIRLSNNGSVTFSGNTASPYDAADGDAYGGAICGDYGSSISLSKNGSVVFRENTAMGDASTRGGAISAYADSSVDMSNNGSVVFEQNTASGSGGAIYGQNIMLCSNDAVRFVGNMALDRGGAIYGDDIMLCNNGSVTFCGNTTLDSFFDDNGAPGYAGGAIYSPFGTFLMNNNGKVEFCGNVTSNSYYDGQGGAICWNGPLSISNNRSVLFEKNAEIGPDFYRLRGIYYDNGASGMGEISLSAAVGNIIEIRDSIYVWSSSPFNINKDFTDSSGSIIKQQGDIIINGAYAEEHLNEVMVTAQAGRTATAEEILASRTTAVNCMTKIYGGRLRVENGAIYQGQGISVEADSGAAVWLRNAQLQHQGYGISFGKGTTFGLRGCNVSQSDNLSLDGGCSLSFEITAENLSTAVLTHEGTLTLGGSVTLSIGTADSSLAYGQYKLLKVNDSAATRNWVDGLILVDGGSYEASDLEWVDNTLCFNYSGQQLSELPLFPEIADIPEPPDEPELPDTPGGDEPGGELPGGDEPGSNEPGGELPGGDEPGGNEPGGELPGGDEPGGDLPGGDEPGGELPGGDDPGGNEPGLPDTPVTPDKPEQLKPFRPGDSALVSGEIDKNLEVILNGKGTITLEGKVNAGAITVNVDKNLTLKGDKKKGGSLVGEGDLTKKGKGTLTLNDGNNSWKGDTYLEAGTIKVKGATSFGKGDVYVKGGTLNLGSKAIGNDIVQEKSAAIKSGKKFTGTYTLESGELQKGSTLNINKTATLEGGTVNGTLSGNGKTTVIGKVKLGDKGKLITKALTLGEDATLTTSAKGLSSKTTTLSIGEDATLSLGGKMTVDSLKMNGGTLKTTGSKPAAITVKNDMVLTDAVLTSNGKVTTNKLSLNDSTMSIKGAKAQNLTVKQNLTIGSGSALTLNGKLSAGSLTIKKDGMLTMSGSKPVTLKVKGALTLNEGSSIIMNYSFVQGKTYKVLTFGSYSGSKDYYSIFGVEADDCTIINTGKALTLTVNTKWKPQTQQKAVGAAVAEPVVATKPQANPVADALVQANWGQLEASRAFVNAMANRSMAVQLGNGERAVWASAIGSSSRHDTAGGHNGADTNVSGGAFGLETQVGRASLFGLALGNSWTRVSAHGFGTIEQDTTHLGLYGQTNWRSGVTADWSAAYGRSDSETMGSDWNQKHLQLDGRVSYNHELNARTVLSPFAGVQYYASDAATVDGTDTGSLQNLRAEIGVGASHRTGKLGIFGEIAVHQDMARSNPTVSMEGVRSTGMNPGRTGINFTIGASYELNAQWSVNASYTGEFVENANAHSANIGASYKF